MGQMKILWESLAPYREGLKALSEDALRAMLDMGGALTPYIREELDRRHADEESHTRLADKRENHRPD